MRTASKLKGSGKTKHPASGCLSIASQRRLVEVEMKARTSSKERSWLTLHFQVSEEAGNHKSKEKCTKGKYFALFFPSKRESAYRSKAQLEGFAVEPDPGAETFSRVRCGRLSYVPNRGVR